MPVYPHGVLSSFIPEQIIYPYRVYVNTGFLIFRASYVVCTDFLWLLCDYITDYIPRSHVINGRRV